jgi:hypothetical protein
MPKFRLRSTEQEESIIAALRNTASALGRDLHDA